MNGSPVQLDLELCKACGVCIELCPDKVFDRDKLGYPMIARPEECSQCLLCELHCPDFAIEVRRRERKDTGERRRADARRPHRGLERRACGRRRVHPRRRGGLR